MGYVPLLNLAVRVAEVPIAAFTTIDFARKVNRWQVLVFTSKV